MKIFHSYKKGTCSVLDVKQTYLHTKNTFHEFYAVDSVPYGKMLAINSKIQATQSDNALYDDLLVQPAMLSHPNPKRVLIIGSPEGGVAREVLKYSAVEKVVMVYFDKELVDICEKYLPEFSAGAFQDPRLELVFDDPYSFVEKTQMEKFDVAIIKIVDPIESSLDWNYFSQEFIELIAKKALVSDGIFATEATGITSRNAFPIVHNTCSTQFKQIVPYICFISSLNEPRSFIIATNGETVLINKSLSIQQIQEIIDKKIPNGLKGLSAEQMRGMFLLMKELRDSIKNETKVFHLNQFMSLDN